MKKKILIVGTYDTKEDELRYLEQTIIEQGGATLTMDVSVLKGPKQPTGISKHEVTKAAGSTIEKQSRWMTKTRLCKLWLLVPAN